MSSGFVWICVNMCYLICFCHLSAKSSHMYRKALGSGYESKSSFPRAEASLGGVWAGKDHLKSSLGYRVDSIQLNPSNRSEHPIGAVYGGE